MASSDVMVSLNEKAFRLLQEDAGKIEKLIAIQMENLATRKCPLYEEVLDTQMYGFSRAVDFAVRAGLVEEAEGKQLVSQLERNLALLYEALAQKAELEA
ncbi:YlaN family protein [Cohnella sp. 56]|uniref:YlaN family protein n=1 Tax=Cohnella sp. 56 TaxID=3113722 RepID=UPI0030EA59B1